MTPRNVQHGARRRRVRWSVAIPSALLVVGLIVLAIELCTLVGRLV